MKRVYFTLALMSLFGGLNAFAQTYTTIGGVKYGLMQDNKCVVIGDDGATGDGIQEDCYPEGSRGERRAACPENRREDG